MGDIYPVPKEFAKRAWVTETQYDELYQRSIEDPDGFWGEQAEQMLSWHKPWTSVKQGDFESVRWFDGAELNVCYNCVDRHLKTRADQPAIIWEGDEPDQQLTLTYAQLHEQVCRFANVLKQQGVKKGDRVCLYMPMVPEAAIAMLACTRIGAIHSVVFGGFSPTALQHRIEDAQCAVVITADEGVRGGKHIPLKANTEEAVKDLSFVHRVIVVKHSGNPVAWDEKRDLWWHEAVAAADTECPIEIMGAEDPLFILYTSGSTGKPKGVLHTTAGYLLYTAVSFKNIFDYHDGDIYWCTADVGWITGHSYIVYGPLANGATTLMFAGVPTYPTASRFWEVVDKHQVNIFYTAPTAIRTLMREGDEAVQRTSRKSLRLLGSVGEPINPAAWKWYHEVVGDGRCPIVDTWWQTETGGIMLTPLPGAMALKPGAATKPFFGIVPAIVNHEGAVLTGEASGDLVITQPWPGQLRTVYGNHQRYLDTYLKQYPGCYFSGDGAHRDKDGDYWITGRVDDVINVAGHRLNTASIESALVAHRFVSEAAVVGYPHEVKGQAICAFVTPMANVELTDELRNELVQQVRTEIGPVATPDELYLVHALPKTRSGKIMRRILRKIAAHDTSELGDTSTLADPSVVDDLIEHCRA